MPGFTGFVAILFSFNCQRRDYNASSDEIQEILCAFFVYSLLFNHASRIPAANAALPPGRLTVESRKNLYRAY